MKMVRFWVPVVVWMTAIFFLSGRESVQVSDAFTVNFLFFKTLHVMEYAMLYLLSFRAVHNTLRGGRMDLFMLAFVITVLFAMSDEIHQTFVPTREGTARDVIIDALGASLSWILIAKYLPKAPKKLQNWAKALRII